MQIKRIAAVALANRDFPSFEAKLDEACRWMSLAAGMGADLVVFPEGMNLYRGDGPAAAEPMKIADAAFDHWQLHCGKLLETAAEYSVAATVPLYTYEQNRLINAFYLVGRDGEVFGRYTKQFPTPGEIAENVRPLPLELIKWEELTIGGGICFDMNFPDLFIKQKKLGADLFLCPSLFPGGDQVNAVAASLQTPVVVAYPAWSRIINKLGRTVVEGGYRHETLRFGFGVPVYITDINFDSDVFHFDGNQQQIEPILRKYGADVKLIFDQENVCFLLESLSEDRTVGEISREFNLTPIDIYLHKAQAEVKKAITY